MKNPVVMAISEKKKRFIAVNVRFTNLRDVSDRHWLLILFDATQVWLAVLGSRLGVHFPMILP